MKQQETISVGELVDSWIEELESYLNDDAKMERLIEFQRTFFVRPDMNHEEE